MLLMFNRRLYQMMFLYHVNYVTHVEHRRLYMEDWGAIRRRNITANFPSVVK